MMKALLVVLLLIAVLLLCTQVLKVHNMGQTCSDNGQVANPIGGNCVNPVAPQTENVARACDIFGCY